MIHVSALIMIACFLCFSLLFQISGYHLWPIKHCEELSLYLPARCGLLSLSVDRRLFSISLFFPKPSFCRLNRKEQFGYVNICLSIPDLSNFAISLSRHWAFYADVYMFEPIIDNASSVFVVLTFPLNFWGSHWSLYWIFIRLLYSCILAFSKFLVIYFFMLWFPFLRGI